MKQHLTRALNSQGLRSSALMTVGNIGSTLVAAVAMILISRSLGPQEFGVFSALFSLLLILAKLGDIGVNLAIQREVAKTGEQASSLVQTGLVIKLSLATTLALTGLFFGDYLHTHLIRLPAGSENLTRLVFFLASGVMLYEYVNILLQALQRFALSVATNFAQSSAKLATTLYLTTISTLTSFSGIIMYGIFPLLAATLGCFALPRRFLVLRFSRDAFQRIISVARFTGIAIVSATLAENIDTLIIQRYLSTYDTGLWSAGVRIATVASLVGWSLGTVLNVRVASYSDPKNLHRYLRKATVLSIISFIAIVALTPLSHLALSLTVGPDYLEATSSLQLLLVSTALLTATSPFVALFFLFDYPQYFAYSGLLSTALLVGGDLIAIPAFGLAGAGYVRIIMRITILALTLYTARKSYNRYLAEK